MALSERVHQLKLLLGGLEDKPDREFLPAPELPGGLPRGVMIELVGTMKTEWLLQFLKLHPELRIFWAEREQRILPTAIHQRGVDLSRITFGTFGKDLVIPLRRVVQSQVYQVVIAPNVFPEIRVLKAFQLFCEKANALFFLMAEQPSSAWPISMQLEIKEGPPFKVDVLRQKHGRSL